MNKYYKKTLYFVAAISILFSFGAKETLAQTISLSITPPIVELTIQPGKAYTKAYLLTNNGDKDEDIAISLVPFIPEDEYGNVSLQKTEIDAVAKQFESWFDIQKPGSINFGDKFTLPAGKSQEIALTISPPTDADEFDYYFTLLFVTEPQNITGLTQTQSNVVIGSNILLTVSVDGNPARKASIAEFSAPVLIDSLLGNLMYTLRIKNEGTAYFKPFGKIYIERKPGKKEITLDMAPQNVLARSTRQIFCLDGEDLIECKLDKPVIGIFKATAQFSPDETGQVIKHENTVYAFPFSIIIAIIVAIITVRMIKKRSKNKAKKQT